MKVTINVIKNRNEEIVAIGRLCFDHNCKKIVCRTGIEKGNNVVFIS
jgi:hypothetical protein